MKRITALSTLLIVLLVLVNHISHAQNVKNTKPPLTLYTNESGNYVFDTVINVSGVSKAELYKRAKNWVISTIRTSDKTVVFNDKDSSEIRTDATIALSKFPGVNINFKLSLSFKENKCRIVYTSFMYGYIGDGTLYESAFETIKVAGINKILKEFDNQFPLFDNSLIKSLFKKSDNNW